MDRTDYMRNYMRDRYNTKKEQCRAEQNTRRLLNKTKVSEYEVQRFGIHLADVVKLKKLITIIPPDMIEEVMNV